MNPEISLCVLFGLRPSCNIIPIRAGLIGLRTKCGCPHHCAYCTYPALEGTRFRHREPGAVIEDIRQLQKDYLIESIFFTDSVFNDLQGHYLEIAEGLIASGNPYSMVGFFSTGRESKPNS